MSEVPLQVSPPVDDVPAMANDQTHSCETGGGGAGINRLAQAPIVSVRPDSLPATRHTT